MATPLDIGLLANFKIIFPFLFVFCIVFAAFTYTKLLGDNKIIGATIAIVLAFMTLFSDMVVETINTAAPWFVLLIVFMVFLLLGLMILGVKEADVVSVMKMDEYSYIIWWVIALVVIIMLGSLSHVLAEKKGGYPPYGPGANFTELEGEVVPGQESDFWQTLFHPKVLGMIIILLIGFFTISKLTSTKA